MDKYNIVFTTELISDELFQNVVATVVKRCTCPSIRKSLPILSNHGTSFISAIKPAQEFEELSEDSKQTHISKDCWTEVTTDSVSVPLWSMPTCEPGSENPSELLVKRLHHLGDLLPQIGALTEIIWVYKDENLPNIEENIELYGALKRLLEWNSANVHFASLGCDLSDELKDMTEPWVTMLRGHLTLIDDLDLSKSMWRGHVKIGNSNIKRPVRLPGFELRPASNRDDSRHNMENILDEILVPERKTKKKAQGHSQAMHKILAPQLEFVAQLDMQKVPLFYFTGQCCHLCVTSESRLVDKSRDFLSELEDNRRVCYLVRLNHGTSWRVPEHDKLYKDKQKKERKCWLDFVQDNIENVFNCPTSPELDGELGAYFFLLYAHDADPCDLSTIPTNTNSSEQSCTAHLLRSAGDINGEFVHQSIVASMAGQNPNTDAANPKSEGSCIQSILEDLPCVTGDTIHTMMTDVRLAQIDALQQWIDSQKSLGKSTDITVCDLLKILKDVQVNTLSELRKRCTHELPALHHEDTAEDSADKVFPVTDMEKAVLDYISNADNRFGRFKSNDSLAGLSPPNKGKILTISAAEFLKCFKADGSAVKENLPEVKRKTCSKNVISLGSEKAKDAPWPESGSYHYHDMYYNQADVEAIEAKSMQLKSRLHIIETSSTCIYRQAHSPATITVATDEGLGQKDDSPEDKTSPGRCTRGATKRKAMEEATNTLKTGKSLYAAKKAEVAKRQEKKSKVIPEVKAKVNAANSKENSKTAETDQEKRVSRSQRHKQKLEEVVKDTLKSHGVEKDNPLFKSCALRLYNITKMFVKDLTNYQSLRLEMEKIAQSNVKTIVDFEKDRLARNDNK